MIFIARKRMTDYFRGNGDKYVLFVWVKILFATSTSNCLQYLALLLCVIAISLEQNIFHLYLVFP